MADNSNISQADGNRFSVEGFEDIVDPAKSTDFNFTIREEIGLFLPVVQLSFSCPVSNIQHVIGNNREFKINLNDDTFEFVSSKVTCKNDLYTIAAIANNLDFANKNKQGYFEGTSIDALKDAEYVTVEVAEEVTTDDEQIWINGNTSERHYLSSILEHSYVSEDDFLMYAMKDKETITVTTYKKLMDAEPKWDFGTTDKSKNRVYRISFETIPFNQYQLLVNKTGVTTSSGFDDSYGSDYDSDNKSMVMIDAGNCHDNYFSGALSNLKNYAKLYEKVYDFDYNIYLGIKPLDTLIIRQSEELGEDDDSEIVSKPMVVLRVDTTIKGGHATQHIYFSRQIEEEEENNAE